MMHKRLMVSCLTVGVTVIGLAATTAGPSEASPGHSTGETSVSGARGVSIGVETLRVANVAAAQKVLGKSSRLESGKVNAYTATYNPKLKTGYFAVTKDQGISLPAARTRLSAGGATGAAPGAAQQETETVLVFSKFTRTQIDNSLASLTNGVKASKASAAFYYDAATDSIQLSLNGSPAKSGFKTPVTTVPVSVAGGQVKSDVYRENMPSPFRGGGAIFNLAKSRCTSGIPAYNASGTRGYFTAAHCFSLGVDVWSSSTLAGGSNTGKVSHRYGTDNVDAEFVSGKTYVPRIYTSTDFSVSKPVVGSYFPAAGEGNRLCFSGSTTGVQCGNSVVAYNQTFCVDGDCTDNMIALRGGVSSEGGDSGGPVYANFGDTVKVTGIIRGHVDPFIGESTTYVTDWRRILQNYGATLMLT